MPIQHLLDASQGLVITSCIGQVTREEIIASFKELRRQSGFHPEYRQIADLTQVSNLNLSFSDAETIHRIHDPFSKHARRAVVASKDSTVFGVSRMYAGVVQSEEFAVFTRISDAIVWLKLDTPVLQPASTRGSSTLPSPEDAFSQPVELPSDASQSIKLKKKRAKKAHHSGR
jgi:hypothetical protein